MVLCILDQNSHFKSLARAKHAAIGDVRISQSSMECNKINCRLSRFAAKSLDPPTTLNAVNVYICCKSTRQSGDKLYSSKIVHSIVGRNNVKEESKAITSESQTLKY